MRGMQRTGSDIEKAPFYLSAAVDIAAADTADGSKRKVTGVAYSGEVVNHPYAGRVVFDLSTTSTPEKMPLLVEHDRAQRAGVGKLAINADNITIDDGYLLPNAAGSAVAADADAGFPWQLSVHIQPAIIDTIGTGETAVVNGKKVDGPLSIFRNSLIREVSFTPTGVDSNTSAAVFSTALGNPPPKEKTEMSDPTNTVTEETVNTAVAAAVAAAVAPLQASLDAANTKITALETERDASKTAAQTAAKDARLSAVKTLFADTGRAYTEEAAAPYCAMSEEVFAAVSKDLIAAKPKLPGALFSHVAKNGGTTDIESDPEKFSAAITSRIATEAAKGNTISVLQAAALIRSEQTA